MPLTCLEVRFGAALAAPFAVAFGKAFAFGAGGVFVLAFAAAGLAFEVRRTPRPATAAVCAEFSSSTDGSLDGDGRFKPLCTVSCPPVTEGCCGAVATLLPTDTFRLGWGSTMAVKGTAVCCCTFSIWLLSPAPLHRMAA